MILEFLGWVPSQVKSAALLPVFLGPTEARTNRSTNLDNVDS